MKKYLKFIYSIWSRIYDKYIDPIFYFDRKKVIEALKLKKHEQVLEVGVGTGLNLPHYPRCVSVTGVDFSKAMLSKAKKKRTSARVTLKLMDASKLSFKSNSFDKVLATYVLRVVPNPKAVLKEVARVTKPGALFVVLDQFREKDVLSLLFSIVAVPFKLALGWGKDPFLDEIIRNTPWKVYSQKRFGKMKGTKLVVLKNSKK